MKITFVGTGTMGSTTRCNTSMLVDDILIDVGMGTVKQLERLKLYTKSIKYVLITHFHADHFLDIPNLLFGRKVRNEIEEPLVFIGPKGLKEKTIQLMNFTHDDENINKYKNMEEKYNVKFIELEDKENFETDEFKVTAVELNHGPCKPVNGYIVEKENKKIGFAWDTTLCENYYKMCEQVEYIFLDVTGPKTKEMHIGLEDYLQMHTKYPKCKFYAVHRGDYEIPGTNDVVFPMDGDSIEV